MKIKYIIIDDDNVPIQLKYEVDRMSITRNMGDVKMIYDDLELASAELEDILYKIENYHVEDKVKLPLVVAKVQVSMVIVPMNQPNNRITFI